jgi:hypothetical protein
MCHWMNIHMLPLKRIDQFFFAKIRDYKKLSLWH